MAKHKTTRAAGVLSSLAKRANPSPARGVELVPGLWQFEDDQGQTYLAVKTLGWKPSRGRPLTKRELELFAFRYPPGD